jgi:uncharacterized protein (TIGR04255 family)
MKLPIHIEVCPIVDAIVELRFEPAVFPNAVFGMLFNSFTSSYPEVEKLPILQLPEQARDEDPGLRFKPHYKISNDNFVLQIGPRVLTFSSKIPYRGWSAFMEQIANGISILISSGIVERIVRMGHRYINFFSLDIFENIKLKIILIEDEHKPNNTVFRTLISKNGVDSTLQIGNNLIRKIDDENVSGSIIDIDTFINYTDDVNEKKILDDIHNAHETEKEIFFTLLNNDFLLSLKPQY